MTDPAPDAIAGHVCTRWTRYGNDRVYVAAVLPDGSTEPLGYRDLRTGVEVPKALHHADRLSRAARAWVALAGPGLAPEPAPVIPVEQPVAKAPAVPPPPQRPWRDLSQNRPGAAVREVAVAKRAEAPIRTRLARVVGVHTDERAWRIGADGEEAVARELERLNRRNPMWTAIHSVPVGHRGSDIDHVILGPGGVFTANAKHHPNGKVWVGGSTLIVNGTRTDYVRNSRHEAQRAARLLAAAVGFPIHVTALIVLVGVADLKVKSHPEGCFVVTRRDLVSWLDGTGQILPREVLGQVWEMARRSTTWEC